jgi:multisubunit Na+/H+ antiporter MnhG subunit
MNTFKTILTVIAIIAIASIIIPFIIKYFFLALLFMINNPLISLAITGAFLLGMFFNEKADKLNS